MESLFQIPFSETIDNLKVGERLEESWDYLQSRILGRPREVVCGPLLKYIGINYTSREWRGSILVVSNDRDAPPIDISITEPKSQRTIELSPKGEKLDTYRHQYHFWRYELHIPLLDQPQIMTYSTPHQSWAEPSFQVHLPAIQQSMRFMFYSCNGFSDYKDEVKNTYKEKENPLWQDALDRHNVMPFHVLLGGGDQLYNDRLMKEPFMKPWSDEKDPETRINMKLTDHMKSGFEEFYFSNYCLHFGFKGNKYVAKAFATIPSVNMWDDHDIIDGYGSYPTNMQEAECFKVLFKNAVRFYYLFQHHTTMELSGRHGMIRGSVETCNHIITTLGPDIGFVALDCRGERQKKQICQPASYDAIFNSLQTHLPPTVKHLLILTGVPLIYPRLSVFESILGVASTVPLATLAGKTGALGDIVAGNLNKWNGDPELLDDMNDHWTSASHDAERTQLITRLQGFARERSVRVSFLGGDVHVCASGKLFSKDMKEKEEGDPYFMVQIVSSAIVNLPPPDALLTAMDQSSSYITFNGNTEERMFDLFKFSPDGTPRTCQKLMGMRNYCAGYYDEKTGKVNFWIQVEKTIGEKGTKGYLVDVPKLVFGQAGYHLTHLNKTEVLNDLYEPGRQPLFHDIEEKLHHHHAS